MTKKQAFIEYVKDLFNDCDVPEDARDYWDALIGGKDAEKPLFTENGKNVLKFLQEHQETETWKAKDIATEMMISSRSVAGSARKLVSDGYLEKVGQDPVFYTLTNKGKEINLD